MLYIRAEQEGDFSLHLYACHRILLRCITLELRKGQYSVPSYHGEFELASVPTSLSHDNGDPRFPKNKSILMNKMKIEVSSRGVHPESILIDLTLLYVDLIPEGEIDEAGLLHKIHWPKGGFSE